MKKIALALCALSFSAFAGNPELEAIIKKYESHLYNFKVGMTSQEKHTGRRIIVIEPEAERTEIQNDLYNKVILKIEGRKVYSYETYTDLETGEVSASVSLDDHNYNSDEDSEGLSNIKVQNHVLTADFNERETDENGGVSTWKGTFQKELLSPMTCGSVFTVQYEYEGNGGVIQKGTTTSESKCTARISIAEVKKIDLSAIEFCDFTSDDYDCEVKDMSHLTSDL